MKILKYYFAFLLSIIMVFNSCNDNPNKPEEEVICKKYGGDVLLPGELDNKWQYQLWRINDENIPDTVSYDITDTISLKHENKIYKCFIAAWDYLNSNVDWLSCNEPDGLYSMGAICGNDTFISPILEFKYPVNKGESWQVPQLVYNLYTKEFYYKDTLTITCLDVDQQYISSLDTFSVIEYSFERTIEDDILDKEVNYYYYSPGIGIIGILKTTYSWVDRNHFYGKFKILDYCLY